MEILNQKKAILENDISVITTRNSTDLNSEIYHTNVKVAQFRMVAENIRLKEEARK